VALTSVTSSSADAEPLAKSITVYKEDAPLMVVDGAGGPGQ
jgi:hypothetical protein